MINKQIKELFYSNGSEIFGPISYENFCENKYYKSTMVWFEGIAGWINICDVAELKHLVGTMPTPNLDSIQPQTSSHLTPPLSKKILSKTNLKETNNIAWFLAGGVLVVLLVGWFIWGKNDRIEKVTEVISEKDTLANSVLVNSTDSVVDIDTAALINNATTEAEKKTHRMNWDKFVTLKANKFRKIEFGGIDNLKLMITNTSPYKIDFVKVYVEYLKANNDTALTAILEFHDVKPNETKELFAPDCKRGVSLRSSILNIKSYGMNFCWDKKIANRKGEDPFKCK